MPANLQIDEIVLEPVQVYLRYYVASKLRSLPQVQWISYREGCYRAMRCLLLHITNNFLF
jgi:hypothetical protein